MTLPREHRNSNHFPAGIETPDDARWTMALHHASHAVIGNVLDVPYSDIRLGCTDGGHLDIFLANRHALERRHDFSAAWPCLRRVVMFVLAGCVAEWHQHPTELLRINIDTLEASSALALLVDDALTALIEIADATLRLVQANWHCIEHVARELLAQERLAASDVEHLVRGLTVAPDESVDGGSHVN